MLIFFHVNSFWDDSECSNTNRLLIRHVYVQTIERNYITLYVNFSSENVHAQHTHIHHPKHINTHQSGKKTMGTRITQKTVRNNVEPRAFPLFNSVCEFDERSTSFWYSHTNREIWMFVCECYSLKEKEVSTVILLFAWTNRTPYVIP